MTTMYDRIIIRCKELGITPGYVCDSIGIRRSFMSELKSGRTKCLSCDNVAVISDFLDVSCDYLIKDKEHNQTLSGDEKELLFRYRQATLEEKENVMFVLRKYAHPDEKELTSAV